jgi:hypothetical protein
MCTSIWIRNIDHKKWNKNGMELSKDFFCESMHNTKSGTEWKNKTGIADELNTLENKYLLTELDTIVSRIWRMRIPKHILSYRAVERRDVGKPRKRWSRLKDLIPGHRWWWRFVICVVWSRYSCKTWNGFAEFSLIWKSCFNLLPHSWIKMDC